MERDEVIDAHESYAVAVLTRVSGGTRLFGAALDVVPSFVELTIQRAEMRYDRELLDDRICEASTPYSTRHLVTLRFSEVQLAEMLMSAGAMPGVPATIVRLAGKQVAEVPDTHRTAFDRVHEQVMEPTEGGTDPDTERRLHAAAKALRELIATRVPKKDQRAFLWHLEALETGAFERARYAASRVREATQKMVSSAKGEIHAAFTAYLVQAGRRALGLAGVALPEGTDPAELEEYARRLPMTAEQARERHAPKKSSE